MAYIDDEVVNCSCCEREVFQSDCDKDIRETDGVWVCCDCESDYLDEVLYDTSRAERFYV